MIDCTCFCSHFREPSRDALIKIQIRKDGKHQQKFSLCHLKYECGDPQREKYYFLLKQAFAEMFFFVLKIINSFSVDRITSFRRKLKSGLCMVR